MEFEQKKFQGKIQFEVEFEDFNPKKIRKLQSYLRNILEGQQAENIEIEMEEVSEDKYTCPECNEKMTIDEMLEHRLSEHDLSVIEQLEDVPENLGEQE